MDRHYLNANFYTPKKVRLSCKAMVGKPEQKEHIFENRYKPKRLQSKWPQPEVMPAA